VGAAIHRSRRVVLPRTVPELGKAGDDVIVGAGDEQPRTHLDLEGGGW
jgi:hypothetical protein